VSVQTTRENPKPLVKKSHVFFRLFEESKMCFKRVDIYNLNYDIVVQIVWKLSESCLCRTYF